MMEGEKQSRLGSLDLMTLPQLQALLDKKEKLLARKGFVKGLSDGGKKLKDFVAKLRDIIATRHKDSLTHTDPQSKGSHIEANASSEAKGQSTSRSVRNTPPVRGGDGSSSEWNRETQGGSGEVMDSTAELSSAIDSLVISELAAPRLTDRLTDTVTDRQTDGGNLETRFTNSYKAVMKRQQTSGSHRQPFKPSRSLKISEVSQLPDIYKFKSRTSTSSTPMTVNQSADSSSTADQSGDRRRGVDQSADSSREGAVPGPRYRFQGALEISLKESLKLQKQQSDAMQKLQTLQAAERLAERLNIKTGDYTPPALDMQYRTSGGADDGDGDTNDSDDNNDNNDDSDDDDDQIPD